MASKWLFSSDLPDSSSARHRWKAYALAAVSTSAAFVLMWALQGGAPTVPLYPFFTLAVILSALFGGFWPGLLAVGLSVCYTLYFVLRPHYLLLVGEWQGCSRRTSLRRSLGERNTRRDRRVSFSETQLYQN